jgi:multiple sugar transport system permease protein
MIPLWMTVCLSVLLLILLALWTRQSMSSATTDGRQTIVFWGGRNDVLGEDVYTAIHQFEQTHLDPKTGRPKYKVIMGSATSPDITSDAQRMLCAVAGGVPPDVVWFDRFAIGEWAGRDALTDLTPFLNAQKPDDPYRINLDDYFHWAVEETSYKRPGTPGPRKIYGIAANTDLRLLFSNADLLRQEGFVDPVTHQPRPPKTWAELKDYALRLTRFKRPHDPSSGIARLGFAPNFGNSWLYLYAWQAGGQLMNDDRTKVTLDSPPVVRALHFMADVYDELGGFPQVDAYQQSFQSNQMDPFIRGDVAMKIDGVWALDTIAYYRRDMDFIASPAPMPADRLAAGHEPVTWGGGFSYVIPATAHNKQGAWELIQYLSSRQTILQLEQGKRESKESEGRLYLPAGLANRKIYEELVHKYVDENPRMPDTIKRAYDLIRRMMPHTLFRPVTPVGQLLWFQHVDGYEKAVRHKHAADAKAAGVDEMEYCLAEAQRPVQRMLDEFLAPLPASTRVNWTPYFVGYAILCLLPFVGIYAGYKRHKHARSYSAREVGTALFFASPWVVGFICFVGGPIVFSIVFAFTRYDVLAPAHYVGLQNFRHVASDPLFLQSLYNTCFMMLRIPLMMGISLVIAMLLDRGIRGLGFYRTACYMPAIMPIVATALLWWWIYNPNQGPINRSLEWLFATRPFEWLAAVITHLGHYDKPFHFSAPLWLQDEAWAKPGLILMNLWQSGGGIIIWLAGLQSIPDQLYEAASIDGANAWKRFLNVTLPMLSPYVLFNFIIGVIGTMRVFDEAFVMTRGGPNDATLFYAYHLFRQAFQFFRMGYASALAWILFLIILALTLLQLWLSTKWVHYDRT